MLVRILSDCKVSDDGQEVLKLSKGQLVSLREDTVLAPTGLARRGLVEALCGKKIKPMDGRCRCKLCS